MEYRSQGSGADWDGEGGSGCAEVSFELPVGHLSKMERQVDEGELEAGTVQAALMSGDCPGGKKGGTSRELKISPERSRRKPGSISSVTQTEPFQGSSEGNRSP